VANRVENSGIFYILMQRKVQAPWEIPDFRRLRYEALPDHVFCFRPEMHPDNPHNHGRRQFIGSMLCALRKALALEKWRHPKKPLSAE
jgi:hypothetical protein